jgi:hypothetical protein
VRWVSTMPGTPKRFWNSSLKTFGSPVNDKCLYFACHSGLDPESSVFEPDFFFRGNDAHSN